MYYQACLGKKKKLELNKMDVQVFRLEISAIQLDYMITCDTLES